jgi:hypothetical protein
LTPLGGGRPPSTFGALPQRANAHSRRRRQWQWQRQRQRRRRRIHQGAN